MTLGANAPHSLPSAALRQELLIASPKSLKTTVEVQSARHHAGTRYAQDIGFRLRRILDARRVPTDRFADHFAFAQKLGRLSRNYTPESLQTAASDLIDLYESESLDSDTLRSTAVTLFGVIELH